MDFAPLAADRIALCVFASSFVKVFITFCQANLVRWHYYEDFLHNFGGEQFDLKNKVQFDYLQSTLCVQIILFIPIFLLK
jgi:hypothetical protein